MKPASWYMMMLVVGFLYMYVTLVKYIRGQELKDFVPTYDPTYYDERLAQWVWVIENFMASSPEFNTSAACDKIHVGNG